MVECLLRRYAGEFIGRQMTQSAAGSCEQNAADLVVLLAPQALPDGGVLRVDRSQLPAAAVDGVADELSGHDHDFLVGQSDRAAAFERCQRRLQTGAASSADDQHVAVRIRCHLVHRSHRRTVVLPNLRQSGLVVRGGPDVLRTKLSSLSL